MWTENEQKAMEFAKKEHQGQYRKTGESYINHPIDVAAILKKEQLLNKIVTEELVISGFLHDLVEDTSVSIEDINENFGQEVKRIVKSNTEDKDKTWIERKTNTHIKILVSEEDEIYLLLADKLSNIKSLEKEKKEKGDIDWTKFKEGEEKQRWYYVGILQIAKYKIKGQEPTFMKELEEKINYVFL